MDADTWHGTQLDRVFPAVANPYSMQTPMWGKSSWVNQPDPITYSIGQNGSRKWGFPGRQFRSLYQQKNLDNPDTFRKGILAPDFPNNKAQVEYPYLQEVAAWGTNQEKTMFGSSYLKPLQAMRRRGGFVYAHPPRDRQPGLITSLERTDPYTGIERFRTLVPRREGGPNNVARVHNQRVGYRGFSKSATGSSLAFGQ